MRLAATHRARACPGRTPGAYADIASWSRLGRVRDGLARGQCSASCEHVRLGDRARESPGATVGNRAQGSYVVPFAYEVAIVTGGSCGAGREIALALASRGYAVVIVYLRDQGAAEAAVEEILATNGTALAVRAVERLFDETEAAFGTIDMVVHAALRGGLLVNQQAARQLRHGGAIVNLSSADPIPSVLADELRARGITINGLAPGLESPGADHYIADLVALLDRWRRKPHD